MKTVYVILLAIAFVLLMSCTNANVTQEYDDTAAYDAEVQESELAVYQGDGYSFSYPAVWNIKEQEGVVSIVSPVTSEADAFAENVNVMLLPAEEGATLEDYGASALDGLEGAIQGFTLEAYEDALLSETEAKRIVYTESSAEEVLKYVQVFTLQDGVLYVLTFAGADNEFPLYEEDVNVIMDSFVVE